MLFIERNNLTKVTILVAGLLAFGANLFWLMGWPYFWELIHLSTISLLIFLTALFIDRIGKNELGFLMIINTEMFLRLWGIRTMSESDFFESILIAYFVMLVCLLLGLLYSKNKKFYKWNFSIFLIYTIIVISFIFFPSGSSYGPSLLALGIGVRLLLLHYLVIIIFKIVAILRKA